MIFKTHHKNKIVKSCVFIWIIFQIFITGYSFKKNIPFEIQSLLAKNNPIRTQYETDLINFNDETTNWILVENSNPFSVTEITNLSNQIKINLEMNYGIQSIVAPTNAKYFDYDQIGFKLERFIKDNDWNKNSLQELKSELWKNSLIRDDQKAFLISFKTASNLNRKNEQNVFNQIQKTLNQIQLSNSEIKIGILGAKAASVHFLEEMQFQQRILTPLLLLAIIIFFFLCFQSWAIVLWSLFILFICYTSTLCLIIFIEGGLGPYSSFALMFSFIVATADLIHFFGRLQQISGPIEFRIKKAVEISWLPCLLTSLTTSAGFLALIANQNLPIRYFGLYCAFGCMLEWIVIFYALPTILESFNFNPKLSAFNSDKLSFKLNYYLNKYMKSIIIGAVICIIGFSYYSFKLKIDDNFYTKFNSAHKLSKTINLFSDGFDFVGSINLIIKPQKSQDSIFSQNLLSDFKKMETELLLNDKVSRVTSISQLYNDLESKIAAIPNKKIENNNISQSIMNLFNNYGVLDDLYSEKTGEYRTTVFLKSLSSSDLDSVLSNIALISKKFNSEYTIRPSGFSVIRSYINNHVIQDFFESFFISFFLIFLCYLWLYKSIKWSLLALIPNLVPLLAVSGLMGLFQVSIDTNLVILICVAFGISGDNTVHLTYVIQQQQLKGFNYSDSINYAFKLIGIAMIATNAVFIFCLPVFLLGHLRLFTHISIFLSIAFVFAFISDVFMFPALQKKFGWSLHKQSN